MQPLKISILGDYFDCQIYRGRLYLWTFDGDLKVYDWNSLVKSLIKKDTDKIALTFSFLDGNYLYKSDLIELFKDKDFKTLLLKKFKNLEKQTFELTEKKISKFLIGEQTTPKGTIPTDTEIYSNKLYFITDEGLFSGSVHRSKSEKYAVSSRPKKLWDCNLLSIKANKYPQLALSGGDEGLFELNMANNSPNNLKLIETQKPIYQVSENHSSFCNYSHINIFNTSLIDDSFLATFKWDENKKDSRIYQKWHRNFDKNISANELFKTDEKINNRFNISWGIEDKIYRATPNGFEIIKFNNYANEEEGEEKYKRLQSVNLQAWKGQIINGGSAYFGNIIECENALVVTLSNGKFLTIPGPITKWRVYPRSLNYENHLHVIKDDRIEIFSFNQDYFLEQEDKRIGIEFDKYKRVRKPTNSNTSFFANTNKSIFNKGLDLPF
jgi:hypothetical protein